MTIRRHDDIELMSLRRMSDSLEATRCMLTQAQQIAHEAHTTLIGLASEFCGEDLLKRQEQNQNPDRIPVEELALLLRGRFKALKLVVASDMVSRLEKASFTLVDMRQEVDIQRSRAEQAERQVESLISQVRALERTLENERKVKVEKQAPASASAGLTEFSSQEITGFQEWYATWKVENRAWERDSAMIRFIGESGLSYSTELEATIERKSQTSPRTTRRVLKACIQAGLLEQTVGKSLEGRPPKCYKLTAKGRWLYIHTVGEAPKTPVREELLKMHKSDRHLAVILKVAELFEHLGITVERYPPRLEIDVNRYFQPDLALRKDDETFYLEVESGEKDKPSFDHKWENALAAGGRICVATDNLNNLRRIQGNIAQWSRLEGRVVTLYITYLDHLKQRGLGESPWYAVKEYSIR